MDENSSTEYQHKTLKSASNIRLLVLHSGKDEDELRCEIQERVLGEVGLYECISYVWGDVSQRLFITVVNAGDNNSPRKLSIPNNLDLALRRFRRKDTSRVLWADSICINQNDIGERNSQVKLMGQIYLSAETVLIWLGEESEPGCVQEACRCMESMARVPKDKLKQLEESNLKYAGIFTNENDMNAWLGVEKPTVDELHHQLGIPLLASNEFASFRSLIRNPWFTRAWTWQESFAAKMRTFNWSDRQWKTHLLLDACLLIYTLHETNYNKPYAINAVSRACSMITGIDYWKKNKQRLTLSVLLNQRRGAGCKLPSDLVYSLLGVAQQCPDIDVDYETPFTETFARSTFLIIRQKDGSRVDADLPSWVPDWRNRDAEELSLTAFNDRYAASGSSTARAGLSADTKTLRLLGISFERIIGTIPRTSRNDQDWVDSHLSPDIEGCKKYTYTNETTDQLWRRVSLLDLTTFTSQHKVSRWKPSSHKLFDEIVAHYQNGEQGRLAYAALLHAFIKKRDMMTFFSTGSGHIGAAHKSAEVGDEIVYLCGGKVPFLLRRTQDRDTYEYVAECYVHGFMDGEAFVQVRKAARPEEQLEDDSWVRTIGDGALPFPLEEFQIV